MSKRGVKMPDFLANWSLAKVAYSIVLIAVVWFFVQELYRVWFERRLYIAEPVYFSDGKVDAAHATAFGGMVLASHHRMESDLRAESSAGTRDDSVKTERPDVYDRVKGLENEGPTLPIANQQLDLKISGFDIGGLLAQLRRWVSPSNEASLTVEARSVGPTAGLVEGAVSWPQAPTNAGEAVPPLRFFSTGRVDSDDAAAAAIAARFLWADLVKDGKLQREMPVEEFARWIRALGWYRTVRDGGRAPGKLLPEETQLLKAAGKEIQPLLDGRKPVFVEVSRLAANMLAFDPSCIPGDVNGFDYYKHLYLASVGKLPPATHLAATPSAAIQKVAEEIGPGSLVWSSDGSRAAKVTAVVRNANGDRFLLMSGLLVDATSGGGAVYFGAGKQDKKPVAAIVRVLQLGPRGPAVALARMENGITATNGALGKDTSVPKPSDPVHILGQSSVAVVYTVGLATRDLGEGLIAVKPKVTGVGDAGAPFVDGKNRLLAMGYAGSEDSSILIPIARLMESEGLSID